MRALQLVLVVLPLLVLVRPVRGDVVSCGPGIPAAVICLTNDVSDTAGGGPLVMGKVYHLSGEVRVPLGQTLTVEDGAVLKFHPNAYLSVGGKLDCGAATLTALADDTAGGDTNADGPSFGAPGAWQGVALLAGSSASLVDGAEIRFAKTGMLVQSSPSIQQTTIELCSGTALVVGVAGRPAVTGCSFRDSDFAVTAPIEALPAFAGNSASGNTKGDVIQISEGTVQTNVVLGPQSSLDGRPFVSCATIGIQSGATLDLRPGTVIKFGTIIAGSGAPCNLGGFGVAGTLLTDGVILTALEDDTIGGDTPKDGFTLGTPGDWGILELFPTSDASALRDTLIRFGGAFTLAPFAAPAIILSQADVVLDDVDVVECSGGALRLESNSYPIVTDCSFSDNLGHAVDRVPVDAVAGFAKNAATNNGTDVMRVSGGLFGGVAAIAKDDALNGDGRFHVLASLTVQTGASLALGAGVEILWSAPSTHSLQIDGTLSAEGTAGDPVRLTSIEDTSATADGGATPAPGDWVGIELGSGAGASVLDGVVIRYAGRASLTNAALTVRCNATIRNTIVELSETSGMDLQNIAQPIVDACTFRLNGHRAVIDARIRALAGFAGCTASGNVLGDYIRVVNGDVTAGAGGGPCDLEIGPQNALAPDLTFVVADDIDVPPGCVLSLLGGTIVKWEGNRQLDVDGALQIGSVGGGTTVLTTLSDDSVAGDTAKDGFTEGAPGAWRGVSVSAPGTALSDVLVRCAGSGGVGIHLVGADAMLSGVRVEDCLGSGLHLASSSLPLVDGCSFDRNDLAVDGVPLRALPGFSNCSASDNKVGDYQRVTEGTVAASVLLRASQSVNGGVFVLATDVGVLLGATLTIEPGTTFKSEGNRRVLVDGTLTVVGAPITFTTHFDDVNGDTNEDMGATVPVPGSWSGFVLREGSDASVVTGLRVRFAGAGGLGAVRVERASPTIVDSLVERSSGNGMRLAHDAKPTVRRTAFVDGLGIPVDGVPIDAVAGFDDNTASGNAPGDSMRVTDGQFTGHAIVSRHNALNGDGVFVVDTSIQVPGGSTLELRQGTILKWQGFLRSLMAISGTLLVRGTGLEPVVLTSVHDDAIGGDTRNDGAAWVPAPGDWGRLEVGFGAAPSAIEHLVARYGGGGASAAIELETELVTARSIRADFSASDGIRGQSHQGDAIGWVAFGCAGDGIELSGGTYDLVHATSASNGGAGVRKGGSHDGDLWSSIAFDNGGAPLVGFVPGQVFFSDAGPDFAGSDGNVDADPLFAGGANGDLALGPGSPCIDAADLGAAIAAVKDAREAPRVLDDGFDGSFVPDMGALERAAYELSFGGEPRLATVMTFTVSGAEPGVAVFALGLLGGETFVPGFGFTLYGPAGTELILGVAPVGQPIALPVPASPLFADLLFGIQAVGLPAAFPGQGHLTNLYRGRVFE